MFLLVSFCLSPSNGSWMKLKWCRKLHHIIYAHICNFASAFFFGGKGNDRYHGCTIYLTLPDGPLDLCLVMLSSLVGVVRWLGDMSYLTLPDGPLDLCLVMLSSLVGVVRWLGDMSSSSMSSTAFRFLLSPERLAASIFSVEFAESLDIFRRLLEISAACSFFIFVSVEDFLVRLFSALVGFDLLTIFLSVFLEYFSTDFPSSGTLASVFCKKKN